MIDGGALTITLEAKAGALAARIDAPPMLALTRMLAGKSVAEAADLAGTVHALAPSAEGAAVLAAAGLPVPDSLSRGMVVEALQAHVAKLNHAWPAAVGLKPALVALPAQPGPEDFARALFGDAPIPRRLADLEAWIAKGAVPGAQALEKVWRHWDGRWGRVELPLWSPDTPQGVIDWNEAVMDGQPHETGIAARVADTDLMREAEARRGRGLGWRLAARIADAALLIDRLASGRYDGLAIQTAPQVGAALGHNGTVLVDLEAGGGVVHRYQRLSPTDFALHPHGLLNRTLSTLPLRPRAGIEAVVTLSIEAVDPALPTRIALPSLKAA